MLRTGVALVAALLVPYLPLLAGGAEAAIFHTCYIYGMCDRMGIAEALEVLYPDCIDWGKPVIYITF